MWRRPNCSETDSETDQYLDNCFDCKNFDEHVETCDTHLQLRDNIVTCASNTEKNSVFDTCPQYSRLTGECIETEDAPTPPEITHKTILKNLCKVDRVAVENTGFQCP